MAETRTPIRPRWTASLVTLAGPIPGPFAGQGINCRGCHLVDDAKTTPGGGNRTYADFARRSPISAREDGRTETPRNSPALVNATLARGRPFVLHFDGEFPSTVALVEGTIGRRVQGGAPAAAVRSMRSGLAGGGHRPWRTARAPSNTTKLCEP